MRVPKRVVERMASALKRLTPIVEQQRARDVSEADTVTIVKDVLSQAFGYDKYAELTGELSIRGTYCDVAVKLDGKIVLLIEVKAIGIALDERHIRQVVNYAANQGIEWAILTNGLQWRLYQVIFAKPIDKQLVAEVNPFTADLKSPEQLELLYLFCREGFIKGAHLARRDRQDATSRFLLAALLLNNRRLMRVLRLELRKIVEIRVREDELRTALINDVIKRDAMEGQQAADAMARVGGRGARTRKAVGSFVPAAEAQRDGSMRGSNRSSVELAQLVGAGVLTTPLGLFRRYKGQVLKATLQADGHIAYAGVRYDNPSASACMARKRVTGEEMATNGWSFWQYKDPSGDVHKLADARDAFRAMKK